MPKKLRLTYGKHHVSHDDSTKKPETKKPTGRPPKKKRGPKKSYEEVSTRAKFPPLESERNPPDTSLETVNLQNVETYGPEVTAGSPQHLESTEGVTVTRVESESSLESPSLKLRPLVVDGGAQPVSEDVRGKVSEHLQRILPTRWKFHFDEGRLYVVFMVPNPLVYITQRVVHVACSGSDIKVQVHLRTLPETHDIYKHPLVQPLVPLTSATVKDFSNVVARAVIAVHMHDICIGVDVPPCIEKWYNYPDCVLDTNEFEQPEYEQTLRTKLCSFLVSRRSKRCSSCYKYYLAMQRREERRRAEGEVLPTTRHDYLSPKRMRNLLTDKQKIIRNKDAQLTRLSTLIK